LGFCWKSILTGLKRRRLTLNAKRDGDKLQKFEKGGGNLKKRKKKETLDSHMAWQGSSMKGQERGIFGQNRSSIGGVLWKKTKRRSSGRNKMRTKNERKDTAGHETKTNVTRGQKPRTHNSTRTAGGNPPRQKKKINAVKGPARS